MEVNNKSFLFILICARQNLEFYIKWWLMVIKEYIRKLKLTGSIALSFCLGSCMFLYICTYVCIAAYTVEVKKGNVM